MSLRIHEKYKIWKNKTNLTEKNGISLMSSLQSQSLKSLRCNSAATRVKNSRVGPNPVPSSSLNST